MTEAEILDVLAERYEPPEWVFLRHVPDATARNRGRTADAVAVNCWPSGGLEVHGFEVKTTRADLRRELRTPVKQDGVGRFCDRWWVVVPRTGVAVSVEEIPERWGLIEVDRARATVAKPAPLLTPLPLSREFVVALVRRAAHATKP